MGFSLMRKKLICTYSNVYAGVMGGLSLLGRVMQGQVPCFFACALVSAGSFRGPKGSKKTKPIWQHEAMTYPAGKRGRNATAGRHSVLKHA